MLYRSIAATILCASVLAGCSMTPTTEEATDITISRNPLECRAITHSCPQAYESFTSLTEGCGCRPNPAVESSAGTVETLRSVIERYAIAHILPSTTGEYVVQYVMLAADDTNPPHLKYNIWLVAQEFSATGGTLVKGTLVSEPVALDISEHNTYFIVHSHQTPSAASYDADLTAQFLPEAREWIAARADKQHQDIIGQLVTEAESVARERLGLTPAVEFETTTTTATPAAKTK